MTPRSDSGKAPSGRYKAFGALLRQLRRANGFRSAAALSKLAGLSTNYVSILERGEARPKSETVRLLAAALKLAPADRQRLFGEAKMAGEPRDVQAAVMGTSLWRYLPDLLLLEVEHGRPDLYDIVADELVVDLVRGLGSFLGWISLASGTVKGPRLTRLRAAARRVFDESLEAHRADPRIGVDAPTVSACNVASLLPTMWRGELFADHDEAKRLVRQLRAWRYLNRGWFGVARLAVSLKDERANLALSFADATVEDIINVHDSMTAHRLWNELDLTVALGVRGCSAQQEQLELHVSANGGDLEELLSLRETRGRHIPSMASDWEGRRQRMDCVRAAASRVDLALRLFELPVLADQVLMHPRSEVEAALAYAVDLVGTLSARFRNPPIVAQGASPAPSPRPPREAD